jgi:hypothetical protein
MVIFILKNRRSADIGCNFRPKDKAIASQSSIFPRVLPPDYILEPKIESLLCAVDDRIGVISSVQAGGTPAEGWRGQACAVGSIFIWPGGEGGPGFAGGRLSPI